MNIFKFFIKNKSRGTQGNKRPFLFCTNIYPTQDNEGYNGLEDYLVVYSLTKEEGFLEYIKLMGENPLSYKVRNSDEWIIGGYWRSILCLELPRTKQ